MSFSPHSHLEIYFKANKLSTLKRAQSLTQSDLSDFVYELWEFIPRRTFGLIENAASYQLRNAEKSIFGGKQRPLVV